MSYEDPTAEDPGVPCGPFRATEAVPFSFVRTDWCVMAEGDVYGIKLPNEADAKSWAAVLNEAYETGYANGQNDLDTALRREVENLRALKRSVDSALNLGDGSYRR